MDSRVLIFFTLIAIGAGATARSQCLMGGGTQHKHGDPQLGERRGHAATAASGYAVINDDGNQEATITVEDGYTPSTVIVKRGIPLKLTFDLREEGCTGTVVMKDFGIRAKLTPGELGVVEFTPDTAGTFTFACPMRMIEGTLVVKE